MPANREGVTTLARARMRSTALERCARDVVDANAALETLAASTSGRVDAVDDALDRLVVHEVGALLEALAQERLPPPRQQQAQVLHRHRHHQVLVLLLDLLQLELEPIDLELQLQVLCSEDVSQLPKALAGSRQASLYPDGVMALRPKNTYGKRPYLRLSEALNVRGEPWRM